jgi:hypothetical protein
LDGGLDDRGLEEFDCGDRRGVGECCLHLHQGVDLDVLST